MNSIETKQKLLTAYTKINEAITTLKSIPKNSINLKDEMSFLRQARSLGNLVLTFSNKMIEKSKTRAEKVKN